MTTLIKEQITPQKAMDMSPWDLAHLFGFSFFGDMNPFDHDGYFYDQRDWAKDGYANAIGFSTGDDITFFETGCINKKDGIEEQIRSDYTHLDEEQVNELVRSTNAQIETSKAYWGYESETIKSYTEDDSGGEGELECWARIVETLKDW